MAYEPIKRLPGIFGLPADDPYGSVIEARGELGKAHGEYDKQIDATKKELQKAESGDDAMAIGVEGVLGGAGAGAGIGCLFGPLGCLIGGIVGAVGGGATQGTVESVEAKRLSENLQNEDYILGQSPRAQAAKEAIAARKYDLSMAEIAADAMEPPTPTLGTTSRSSKKQGPRSRRLYQPGDSSGRLS